MPSRYLLFHPPPMRNVIGPQLNRAYVPAWQSRKRFCVLKGGAGSGKSVFCAQKLLDRCRTEFVPKNDPQGRPPFAHRFLACRKVAHDVRESVFKLLEGEINRQGLAGEWKIVLTNLSFRHLPTGAEIITTGLENVERIKSIYNISGIWLEEATEFTKEDFTQLNLRLRGDYPFPKQFLLSFNPVSASHWIAKEFDQPKGAWADRTNCDLFTTTYLHNTFVKEKDPEYVETLHNLVKVDENAARIYLRGEWGIEDPNSLFARDFKREKHVSPAAVYNAWLGSVWVAFDFNVANTALLIQKYDTGALVFKEYHYEGGDLQDLCTEIITDLYSMKVRELLRHGRQRSDYRPDRLVVTGDASGGNRSGLTVGRMTAYEQIAQFFGSPGRPLDLDNFNLPSANPGHNASRLLTNLVLKNEPNLLIHPSCVGLIRDLESVKFVGGAIDKKNPLLTHHLDPLRYFINAELQDRTERYGLPPGFLDKLLRGLSGLDASA
jgi:PBSX family phage terminase large subunit